MQFLILAQVRMHPSLLKPNSLNCFSRNPLHAGWPYIGGTQRCTDLRRCDIIIYFFISKVRVKVRRHRSEVKCNLNSTKSAFLQVFGGRHRSIAIDFWVTLCMLDHFAARYFSLSSKLGPYRKILSSPECFCIKL